MWHEMGEPASMNNEQKNLLRAAAEPGIESSNKIVKDGKLNLAFNLNPNELRYFEINVCYNFVQE